MQETRVKKTVRIPNAGAIVACVHSYKYFIKVTKKHKVPLGSLQDYTIVKILKKKEYKQT